MVALQSRNIHPRCWFCCNFIIAVEQRVVKSCQYEPLFLIHIRVSNLETFSSKSEYIYCHFTVPAKCLWSKVDWTMVQQGTNGQRAEAGRAEQVEEFKSDSLLLIPGLQLFCCISQKNVVFLLWIIEFMTLWPIIAGSISKYIAIVVETTSRYWLVQLLWGF